MRFAWMPHRVVGACARLSLCMFGKLGLMRHSCALQAAAATKDPVERLRCVATWCAAQRRECNGQSLHNHNHIL